MKGLIPRIAGGPYPLVLIAVLGFLAYSNTFEVPFQWDDKFGFIVENPIIKDFSYFLEPSKAEGFKQYDTLKRRYVGFLTFALNYKIHGLDVMGYHIFNLAIHIFNSLLVYFFVILTFRTPFLSKSLLKEYSKYIALCSGLIFVSHPVQTEAVTYIFQRLASLMAFFYLLSLVMYIKWRFELQRKESFNLKSLSFYILSLILTILAMKTKENAFTLPFVIVLYEFLFFSGLKRPRILYLIPFLLTLLIIPLTLIGIDKPIEELISRIEPATRGYGAISRGDYLLTQFRVITTYIRLLFLPVNQTLYYYYPLSHSFFNPLVFMSFLFLLSIIGLGIFLYFGSRFRSPDLRLIAFGIFWFFITLSVESSIVPIQMLIAEYRVYLPSAGAFPAIISGLFLLLRKLENKRIKTVAASSFVLIPLVLTYTTYARNTVWRTETSLWEDMAKKFPEKAEVYDNYTDKAIERLLTAIKLKPNDAEAHYNLGVIYWSEGMVDRAVEHYQTTLRLKPDYVEAHNNLGVAYASEGFIDRAVEHYQTAVKLKPDYAEAHYNLGIAYASESSVDRAIQHYQTAVRLKPDYAEAHYNLGIVYASKGSVDKAIQHYQSALRLKPDDVRAYNNLGNAYRVKGLHSRAIEQYQIALRLKPDYARAHLNLGLAYFEKGFVEEARREFETALQINPDYRKARQYLNRMNKMGQ